MIVEQTEMKELRGMLDELLKLDGGLTAWEIEFLDSLVTWTGSFTERQAALLTKIYRRAMMPG